MAISDLTKLHNDIINGVFPSDLRKNVTGAHGNTPPQITYRFGLRSLLIDWLEFTIPVKLGDIYGNMSDPYEDRSHSYLLYISTVLSSVGLACEFSLYYARNGYTIAWKEQTFGYVVMFNPSRFDMGFHVSMPGKVCSQVFQRIQPDKFLSSLSKIPGIQFSRFDFSLDIIQNHQNREERRRKTKEEEEKEKACLYMTPANIEEVYKNRDYKSRWRNAERNYGYKDAQISKDVFYFGSMKSDLSLRIYDKLLERRAASSDRSLDLLSVLSWVRWELTFRHASADALVEMLLSSGFHWWRCFCSVLGNSLSLLQPGSTDSNISRRALLDAWLLFLDCSDRLPFVVPKMVSTYETALRYICESVGPLLTGLMLLPSASHQITGALFRCWGSGKFRRFENAPDTISGAGQL